MFFIFIKSYINKKNIIIANTIFNVKILKLITAFIVAILFFQLTENISFSQSYKNIIKILIFVIMTLFLFQKNNDNLKNIIIDIKKQNT